MFEPRLQGRFASDDRPPANVQFRIMLTLEEKIWIEEQCMKETLSQANLIRKLLRNYYRDQVEK